VDCRADEKRESEIAMADETPIQPMATHTATFTETVPIGPKEEKKEDRTGLYLLGIGILIVLCIIALSFFVPQQNSVYLNFNGVVTGAMNTTEQSGRLFCESNGGTYYVDNQTIECLDIKGHNRQNYIDWNATNNLIAYGIVQDANAHQIIYNTILSEQNAKAFLSTCTLLSQDFNNNTQTILCKTQGGG
jgi:hypothetical protein